MLIRNICQRDGLCNGTRLIVLRLGHRVIEAKIISGANAGDIVLLPRIVLYLKMMARYQLLFEENNFQLELVLQ